MKDLGILLGIASIILALFFGSHLIAQDDLARAKLKTGCICKDHK